MRAISRYPLPIIREAEARLSLGHFRSWLDEQESLDAKLYVLHRYLFEVPSWIPISQLELLPPFPPYWDAPYWDVPMAGDRVNELYPWVMRRDQQLVLTQLKGLPLAGYLPPWNPVWEFDFFLFHFGPRVKVIGDRHQEVASMHVRSSPPTPREQVEWIARFDRIQQPHDPGVEENYRQVLAARGATRPGRR